MSANFCLSAVAATLQLGRRNARFNATGAAALEARNEADTDYATLSVATPTADDHAATKAFVENLINGLSWKKSARAGSATNITIASPGASIGGVTMATDDRVLLIGQTTPSEEGLWVWNGAASPMTRPDDYAAGSTQRAPSVFVDEGTSAGNAYVGQADPIIVDTTDPDFVNFASVVAGIVTISLAGGATGVSIIASGSGPTATLRGVKGETGVLSVAVVSDDLVVSVVAGGLDTTQLADFAVTVAKIAVRGTIATLAALIAFGDAGSTVSVGTLPANSRVIATEVDVTTAFDDATMTVDVQVNSVSVQGTTESDLNAIEIYKCDGNEENASSVAVEAVVSAGSAVAGAGLVTAYYLVTA